MVIEPFRAQKKPYLLTEELRGDLAEVEDEGVAPVHEVHTRQRDVLRRQLQTVGNTNHNTLLVLLHKGSYQDIRDRFRLIYV